MKTSVVNKEYLELNKAIVEMQENWKNSLSAESVQPKGDQAAYEAGVPAAALTEFHFDISLFLQWIEETSELLMNSNPALAEKLSKLPLVMTENVAKRWIDEALAFNQVYFIDFASEQGLEEWIPQFLAETAVRPYLQLLAEKVQIEDAVPGAGCPVCGEPVRLATLEEEGKKVCQCPRCLAHWKAKRLECSHCGNTNHETIKFITIEGEAAAEIQVCEECHGYIKVIDTRQYISKPKASMLDLTTIHLDFVAQDHGYQAIGDNKEAN